MAEALTTKVGDDFVIAAGDVSKAFRKLVHGSFISTGDLSKVANFGEDMAAFTKAVVDKKMLQKDLVDIVDRLGRWVSPSRIYGLLYETTVFKHLLELGTSVKLELNKSIQNVFEKADADVYYSVNNIFYEAKTSVGALIGKLTKVNSRLNDAFLNHQASAVLAKVLKAEEEGLKFVLASADPAAWDKLLEHANKITDARLKTRVLVMLNEGESIQVALRYDFPT